MATSVRKDEPFVKIPYPRPTRNVHRGYADSEGIPAMKVVSIRLTKEDHIEIAKTAQKLDMTFSEFVRWASYYTALETANAIALAGFVENTPKKPKRSLADEGFK